MNAVANQSLHDPSYSLPAGRACWYVLWGLMLILAVASLGRPVQAQSPSQTQSGSEANPGTAYFHRAAQHYLAGDVESARTVVEDGLQVAPDHPKLNALRTQIEALPPPPRPSDEGAQGAGEGADDGEDGTGGSSPDSSGDEAPGDEPSESEAPPDADSADSGDAEAEGRTESPSAASPPSEQAPGNDGTPGTASTPPGHGGDPSPNANPPEAADEPPEVQNAPASSSARSASNQPPRTLTYAEAEQLLQLVAQQEQPLMRAMQSFGRPSAAGPDW